MKAPLIKDVFRAKPDDKGRVWRWRLWGGNRKKIAAATQAYTRKASAYRAVNRVATGGFTNRTRKK